MKTKQAIEYAGTVSNLARILGIKPAAVSQWGENVPLLRVYQLKELRPEFFLREKAKQKPAQ